MIDTTNIEHNVNKKHMKLESFWKKAHLWNKRLDLEAWGNK